MTISECIPGDLVVIDENGVAVFVRLGELYATVYAGMVKPKKKKKSATEYTHALVQTYDPDTGRCDRWTWRFIEADTEVIAIHESYAHMREMKAIRHTRTVGSAEVDPMISTSKGGDF